MKATRVTIAIPTFRRVEYLRMAVESARAQTHGAIEIVVSDNDSGDGTGAYLDTLAGDARVRVLRQTENLGMVGNWDACLAVATGEWFLLLSDDDFLEPHAVAEMLAAAGEAWTPEEVGMVYCLCRTVDADGIEVSCAAAGPGVESAAEFGLAYFARERVVFPCGTMLRTADLRAAGGYGAWGVKLGCDAMAWGEAAMKRGLVVCAPALLSNYRVHRANLTSTQNLEVWVRDLQALLRMWETYFAMQSAERRAEMARCGESYTGYFLASVIAQGGHGVTGAARAFVRLVRWRGVLRMRNFAIGMAKLLVPQRLEGAARAWVQGRRVMGAG